MMGPMAGMGMMPPMGNQFPMGNRGGHKPPQNPSRGNNMNVNYYFSL